MSFQVFCEPRPRAVGSSKAQIFAVETEDVAALCAAQSGRTLDNSFQDGLQIKC